MTSAMPQNNRCGKILVITGEGLRHRYFVNQLNARFPLSAVLIETDVYPEPLAHSEDEKNAWDWFFARRKKYEDSAFGPEKWRSTLNHPPLIKIPAKKLNSPETIKIIQSFRPEFIVIFGAGLLGKQILELYSNRIFNLHVGLPRHYRGSSCNFWPIHNGRPEELGAAVHLTNAGIDTGNIAAQAFIELDSDDDEQTLAGKTLNKGIELMISVIQNWRDGNLNFTSTDNMGKLYLRKDFTPGAILRVRRMVESGELKRQINHIKGKNHSG
jgi:folate-dependent phosphoribosylglycinamide formyltransferase PurN